MRIAKVRKRYGTTEPFDQRKITDAIHKAVIAIGKKNGKYSQKLSNNVVKVLEKKFYRKVPTVEELQDTIINVLSKSDKRLAESYSIYRKEKDEIREIKKSLGIKADVKLTVNALEVLRRRYLLKNEKGDIIESPVQMFRRVAQAISEVEGNRRERKKIEKIFYQMMANLEFLPNTPTLMNAGTDLGQLSACFVLPIEDSLKSIFKALSDTALIHQSGGGTGFSFSKLRPKGDLVRSTMSIASGPVTFMTIFDKETDVIKQGGKRRGANMGILRVDHPDILEFIRAKNKLDFLLNFNLSVAVTDKFMEAVSKNQKYNLINPRTEKVVERINARKVFDEIVSNAWKTGDPGIIFIDEINRKNPTRSLGEIESTNPCGEQPLYPYESCNLGSINLTKMLTTKKGKIEIDWRKIKETVRNAVHFLDNVIDANKYPIPEIEEMTKSNRRIGLGIMGWADMLALLEMRYDSKEALDLAEKLMKFIDEQARKKSKESGRKKGSFHNFRKSIWWKKGYFTMRNATVTTIAPTGTISIIAGCSSGIEPMFAISFMRNVLEGEKLFEVNPVFERMAKKKGIYSTELLEKISRIGSLKKVSGIPEDIKKIFVTALDIKPEWHVKMQAVFQKYTDNSVSKTVNLPKKATVNDIRKTYLLAYKLHCKGVTVFRYGSRPQQVFYIGGERTSAESEYAGGCPTTMCVH